MRKSYRTVLNETETELVEKKSRFIASAKPVSSEQEALEFLDSIKSRYRDARHNVYAYSVGGDNIIQRYSDDGEPSGTGGLPVLEAIKKNDVEDVIIVVTRYFGGILLGTGGLARAYGRAAAMGIEASAIVKKVLCTELIIRLDYSQLGKLQAAIAEGSFHIGEMSYGERVSLRAYAPEEDIHTLIGIANDATGGTAGIEAAGSRYITIGPDGRLLR